MKYAAIDIGSNTVLLLVAELRGNKLHTVYEAQRIPRLGKGVDSSGNLHPESMQEALEALIHYKEIIASEYGDLTKMIVTATSAVRDANNREEFLKDIQEQTGFEVKLLSGDEEAEYIFTGALSTLNDHSSSSLIIDIGGGSTELCFGNSKHIIDRQSFQMGSVRFTEKYLPANVPSDDQIQKCRNEISRLLKNHDLGIRPNTKLVGVAGTVTSLAHIISENQEYDTKSLNNIVLDLGDISDVTTLFIKKGSKYFLKKFPEVMKGRSDVFLGGLLILEEVMKYYGFKKLTVSSGGIRHGAILQNFIQ